MSQEVQNNRRDSNRKGSGAFKEVQKEYKEELLEVARVTRVTAWGRQLRFRASVVIGNEKGTIGLGTGKAWEVSVAIEKAYRDAKKNLVSFTIKNGTIPHDITANYKATSVFLHPAVEGTGIIAWGAIRKLMFVSGLKDIIVKRHGGTNPLTNVRATLRALSGLKTEGKIFGTSGWVTENTSVEDKENAKPAIPKKPSTSKKTQKNSKA